MCVCVYTTERINRFRLNFVDSVLERFALYFP